MEFICFINSYDRKNYREAYEPNSRHNGNSTGVGNLNRGDGQLSGVDLPTDLCLRSQICRQPDGGDPDVQFRSEARDSSLDRCAEMHSAVAKVGERLSEPNSGKAVILYDGVCNLCNASVSFVLAHDNMDHFRFAPLQGEVGSGIAARHGLTPDLSTFFLIEGENALERSDAWLEIMRLLGPPWSASYVLKVVPRAVRDWTYNLIARNRYRWFGRQEFLSGSQ